MEYQDIILKDKHFIECTDKNVLVDKDVMIRVIKEESNTIHVVTKAGSKDWDFYKELDAGVKSLKVDKNKDVTFKGKTYKADEYTIELKGKLSGSDRNNLDNYTIVWSLN